MTKRTGRFDDVDSREHAMLGDQVLDMIRAQGLSDPETLVTVAMSIMVCALATAKLERGVEDMEELRVLCEGIIRTLEVPDDVAA